MAVGAELRARVEAWIADDPDPVDQAELTTLLDHALEGDSFPVASPAADALADEVIALAAGGDAEEAARQLADRFGAG